MGVENIQTRYRRQGVMVLMSLIETGKERIGYVENLVGGIAPAPRLRNDTTQPFQSAEGMLEVLERVYGDPYRKQTTYQAF